MATYFEVPIANPIKPIWQDRKLPSDEGTVFHYQPPVAYNRKYDDKGFYYDSLTDYDEKLPYCQKYQQSDTIRVQWFGIDDLAGYQYARILNKDGTVYAKKTVTVAQETGTWGGLKLYTATIHLHDIDEGIYFLQLRWKSNSAYIHCLFEPINIKQIHKNTIRFDAYNTYNDQSLVYPSSDYIIQLRVEGCITDKTTDAKFNSYEDQPLNLEFVSGVPFNQYEVTLGYGSRGIPRWMADKVNRITLTTDLKVDGIPMARPDNTKIEGGGDMPLSEYKLKLRDNINASTMDINTHVTVSGGTTTFHTVLGDMPQTMYFYIENVEINGQTVIVQKGFRGKRNFLDYLNATRMVGQGHFYENDSNELCYLHYGATITTTFDLTAANVLKYGVRFDAGGLDAFLVAPEFNVDLTSTGGYYALVKNYTTVTTKTLSNLVSASVGSLVGGDSVFIYFDTLTSIADSATVGKWTSIGGDLPADIEQFDFSQGNGINYLQNNIFRYVTAMTKILLNNQSISTYAIDDIVRWLYDSRNGLDAACDIDLQQNPAAAPSFAVLGFKGIVAGLVNSYTTD